MEFGTYLCNLRDTLFKKMNLNDWSIFDLAIQCDLSYKATYNIINLTVSDIKFSTFIKICENLEIPLSEVLNISDDEIADKEICKGYFVCGKNRYTIKKI